MRGRRRYGLAKRMLDLGIVGLALPIVVPVGAATAAVVALSMGRPVLFRQQRVGRGERVFWLYKFRSMRDPRFEGEGDAERLTALGKALRRTSLDEVPQLLNVALGDMSLVGPRPLLVRYLDRYSARQRVRHAALPGITGWAQVNGRNAMGWARKFSLDREYVEASSLCFDLDILRRTATTVFSRSGVSASGHATMPEFQGERDDGE